MAPTGELVLELVCSTPEGQTSPTASQTVTVNPADTMLDCSGERAPPPGMQRVVNCHLFTPDVDCRSFNELFGQFPGGTGIRQLAMNQNQYLAVEFEPQSIPADARTQLNIEGLQAFPILRGQMLWSISRCPGDFTVDAIAEETGDPETCVLDGFAANAGFNFGGSSYHGIASTCGLNHEPGRVYYLNLLFTEDPAGTPNSELTWKCGPDENEDRCGAQFQLTSIVGW